MTSIVRRIRLACLEFGFELWVCHIPGLINFDPDALSRGVLGKRVAAWSFIGQCRDRWSRAGGGFTVDAFADVSGRNARASRFFSANDDVMSETFKGESVWAFPPPELAEQFLGRCDSWEARVVVAAVPDHLVSELSGRWEVLHSYQGDARVFERAVGEHWVKCNTAGLCLTVVRWT